MSIARIDDDMPSLSLDLWGQIFKKLESKEVGRIASVCQTFLGASEMVLSENFRFDVTNVCQLCEEEVEGGLAMSEQRLLHISDFITRIGPEMRDIELLTDVPDGSHALKALEASLASCIKLTRLKWVSKDGFFPRHIPKRIFGTLQEIIMDSWIEYPWMSRPAATVFRQLKKVEMLAFSTGFAPFVTQICQLPTLEQLQIIGLDGRCHLPSVVENSSTKLTSLGLWYCQKTVNGWQAFIQTLPTLKTVSFCGSISIDGFSAICSSSTLSSLTIGAYPDYIEPQIISGPVSEVLKLKQLRVLEFVDWQNNAPFPWMALSDLESPSRLQRLALYGEDTTISFPLLLSLSCLEVFECYSGTIQFVWDDSRIEMPENRPFSMKMSRLLGFEVKDAIKLSGLGFRFSQSSQQEKHSSRVRFAYYQNALACLSPVFGHHVHDLQNHARSCDNCRRLGLAGIDLQTTSYSTFWGLTRCLKEEDNKLEFLTKIWNGM